MKIYLPILLLACTVLLLDGAAIPAKKSEKRSIPSPPENKDKRAIPAAGAASVTPDASKDQKKSAVPSPDANKQEKRSPSSAATPSQAAAPTPADASSKKDDKRSTPVAAEVSQPKKDEKRDALPQQAPSQFASAANTATVNTPAVEGAAATATNVAPALNAGTATAPVKTESPFADSQAPVDVEKRRSIPRTEELIEKIYKDEQDMKRLMVRIVQEEKTMEKMLHKIEKLERRNGNANLGTKHYRSQRQEDY